MMNNTSTINQESKELKKESSIRKELASWIRFVLFIAVLYFTFFHVLEIKIVQGNSMNPTIGDNDILLVNKLFFQPERGDIVILKDPHGFDIVKRIIGLPHDHIFINEGTIYVNNTPLTEEYAIGLPNDLDSILVGDQEYFVVGDNRTPGESLDSRDSEIGTFIRNEMTGEVLVSLFPPNLLLHDK